jgi:hypothetical protein
MKLSVGRVSGSALRPLDLLVRQEPLRALLAAVVRRERGIEAPARVAARAAFGRAVRARAAACTRSS